MGFLSDKWNKNRFSIYNSEEKTVLKIIENINNFLGYEVIKEVENKVDVNGEFNGSWQGITKPSQSNEGMATMVQNLWDNANVNVKDYGAKGDGVADDTISIKNALTYAFQNNKTLFLPKGNYKIISDEKWECSKIYSDGATLNITGQLRFLFVGNINIHNIKIITTDGGGYGVDDLNSNGYLFYPKDNNATIEYADISNVQIEGNTNVDKRIIGGIRINQCSQYVNIKNVIGKNCGGLISLLGTSNNVVITDIKGSNIETLVQAQGVNGSYFNNLNLINNANNYSWWIGQNRGIGVNGKDCLLIESGQNVKITNLKGEYCIERPIYCQASIVYANDLESINTGCFKFVGKQDGTGQIKNIYVGNAIIRETVSNDRDGYGQIYGVDDIYYDNLKIFSSTGTIRNFFFIGSSNGKITFNNIECYGLSRGLFSKSRGITNEMIINNMYYESNEVVTIDAILMVKDKSALSTDMINKLTVNSITTKTGTDFNTRTIIYDTSTSLISNKVTLNNINIDCLGTGQYSIYGVNDLKTVELNNIFINNKMVLGGFNGTSMFTNRDLISNFPIKDLKIYKKDIDTELNILINKNNNEVKSVLDYIKEISFIKSSSDYTFELPVKTTKNWKITVNSLKGGYAEFILFNGVLTEKYNSNTLIQMSSYGTTPTVSKLSLYVNTDTSFLTFRNRIESDEYKIKVERI